MLRQLTEVVFSNGVIPKDWEESHILNLYKGNGEALDRGNYRGLKQGSNLIFFSNCKTLRAALIPTRKIKNILANFAGHII
jgi:hypothetical protein